MRILHFEDEWASVRPIPHWLHDRIFTALPPADAVELELTEEENPKDEVPTKVTVSVKRKTGTRDVFEYLFVKELDTLKKMAGKDDIVIVDIMRGDKDGHFVSVLEQLLPILVDGGFSLDNWRYFSNYPEKIGESSDLKGFMKKQHKELVGYLFEKVWSHWSPQ